MDAIILAGGLGTRLRSVVSEVPKCMAPVAGKPFLWYLLQDLKSQPVEHVVLSVGYLREVIFEWIDKVRDEFPFAISYAIEDTPLGTGGGIRLALNECSAEEVLILNGDTYFQVDLQKMLLLHRMGGCSLSIALKPMKDFNRYGAVEVDWNTSKEQGIITRFCEKQPCEEGVINGGVYLVSRKQIQLNQLPNKFSFEKEVLEPRALTGELYGIVSNGYFIDIGIPEDYERAGLELPQLIA